MTEQLQERKELRGFKKFLYETFRPHSMDEYRAFLLRGTGKSDEGGREYKAYPFVYMRVFVVTLFITAVTFWVMLATGYTSTLVASILFGALVANVPALILIYELYPLKNFSLTQLLLITLGGGLCSILLAEIIYAVIPAASGIGYPFYIGFVEEFSKALPAIILILALKKRTPFEGLLIGCAVGMGFSAIEDTAYIVGDTVTVGFDSAGMLTVIIVRGVTSLFGHISWTGFIGWAFNKYKKPYQNARFYGVLLASYVLHSVWDLQLAFEESLFAAIAYIPCSIIALVFLIRIIKRERKLIYLAVCPERFYAPPAYVSSANLGDPFGIVKTEGSPDALLPAPAREAEQLEIAGLPEPVAIKEEQKTEPGDRPVCSKLAFVSSLMLGLCIFVISCCGFVYGYGYSFWYQNDKSVYSSKQEFISAVQNSRVYDFDINRSYSYGFLRDEYNDAVITDGQVVSASQIVEKSGYSLVYWYDFDYDKPIMDRAELTDIVLRTGEKDYYIMRFGGEADGYNAVVGIDGSGEAQNGDYFFICDENVVGAYYDETENSYVAMRPDVVFTGLGAATATYITAGVSAAGAVASAVYLKTENKRRNKNA